MRTWEALVEGGGGGLRRPAVLVRLEGTCVELVGELRRTRRVDVLDVVPFPALRVEELVFAHLVEPVAPEPRRLVAQEGLWHAKHHPCCMCIVLIPHENNL